MRSRTSVSFYFQQALPALIGGLIVAVASVITACFSGEGAWIVLGGGLLTLVGIPMTFARLIRLGAAASDDPDPPPTLPGEGPGAQLNHAFLAARLGKITDNFSVLTGVVLLMLGTLLAAVIAPLLDLLDCCSR